MKVAVLILLSIFCIDTYGQGAYGTGRLPRTQSRVRRELKTIVVVESINPEEMTFKGVDEITGDRMTYKLSKRTEIKLEKGMFDFFGKKEIAFSDIQKGQRLEIKYNEYLPSSVTEIKVLKPRNKK
ncbi:MAG: hypothetical protein RMM17_13755 [Acidobacteriota bacterium]|nr:hypothetical protein [Blastocatellia bacterium]MDW8413733.1 hypothetical protein [Acidobacteriota bacterium]